MCTEVPLLAYSTSTALSAHERSELLFMTVGVNKLVTSWFIMSDILNLTTVGVCAQASLLYRRNYTMCARVIIIL